MIQLYMRREFYEISFYKHPGLYKAFHERNLFRENIRKQQQTNKQLKLKEKNKQWISPSKLLL